MDAMGALRVLGLLPLVGTLHACTSLDAIPKPAAEPLLSRPSLAKARPGFVAFCERSPSQCSSAGSAAPLSLDAETWKTLDEINTVTNRAIAPTHAESIDREAVSCSFFDSLVED